MILTICLASPNEAPGGGDTQGVTKQPTNMTSFQPLSDKVVACIQDTQACYTTCVICISQHPGEQMMAECIKTCLDCIATTQACGHLMAAQSPLAKQACTMCADSCERCYNECKKHDNPSCKQCAEACRKCMESCRAMAA